MRITRHYDVSTLTANEVQTYWEDAYVRFESPEEEINKFVARLNKLGQKDWSRDSEIVEIFSGRCNGIRALENLGFTNIEGVDISPNLLSQYEGTSKLITADCRELPFEDRSRDVIIVQGGLHHLPSLPSDLERTLSEVNRVLRDDGTFLMIEPWQTPFLSLIHTLSNFSLIRLLSTKFDAFATMTHYEANTYFNWLTNQEIVLRLLKQFFTYRLQKIAFGKLNYVGMPKR